jgi:inner membrane protein
MPSPIGHSLVGYVVFRSGVEAAGLSKTWFLGTCLLIANAPDFDFLPGLLIGEANRYHHRITHSAGFAILVALLFAFLAKFWKRVSFTKHFTLVFGLYSSHLALDYFSLDTSQPYGIPVFWPVSTRYFIAPYALFTDIHRDSSTLSFFGSLFVLHNLWAVSLELALCLPLIVLALVWKKKSSVISF